MYAVLRTGGKQYRVSKDDVIAVERVANATTKAGATITFDDILLIGEAGKAPQIGTPTLAGARVSAEVLEHKQADKVSIIKFHRRKNYRRTKGHRQAQTLVKITDIATKKAATKPSKSKED